MVSGSVVTAGSEHAVRVSGEVEVQFAWRGRHDGYRERNDDLIENLLLLATTVRANR